MLLHKLSDALTTTCCLSHKSNLNRRHWHEVGIHLECDTSSSHGTTHTETFTQGKFIIANPPTGIFLGDEKKSENPDIRRACTDFRF